LRHDERAARDALGLAGAATGNTEAWVDDWRIASRAAPTGRASPRAISRSSWS
jgi:predicted secreted hydrolase